MTWISRTHVEHILDIFQVYRLLRSCLNIKQYTSASTHNRCRIHSKYTTLSQQGQVFLTKPQGPLLHPALKSKVL